MGELTDLMASHPDLGVSLTPIELTVELWTRHPSKDYRPNGTVVGVPILLFGPELSEILRNNPETFQYDGYGFVRIASEDVSIPWVGKQVEVRYQEVGYAISDLIRQANSSLSHAKLRDDIVSQMRLTPEQIETIPTASDLQKEARNLLEQAEKLRHRYRKDIRYNPN